jgi:dimeric dUTPase (all-alpha-NTP-PPase superfamily)
MSDKIGVYEIDNSTTDSLEILFHYQSKLQERLGTWDKVNASPAALQQFMNQMFLAIAEENIEVMKETAYKNPDFVPFGWKKTQGTDLKKMQMELIDMLHFWLNLCIVSGMTPADVLKLYLEKNQINHQRQDEGY